MLQQGVFVLCCSIILDYLVDCWYFIQCIFIFIIEVGYFIGQIEEKMDVGYKFDMYILQIYFLVLKKIECFLYFYLGN